MSAMAPSQSPCAKRHTQASTYWRNAVQKRVSEEQACAMTELSGKRRKAYREPGLRGLLSCLNSRFKELCPTPGGRAPRAEDIAAPRAPRQPWCRRTLTLHRSPMARGVVEHHPVFTPVVLPSSQRETSTVPGMEGVCDLEFHARLFVCTMCSRRLMRTGGPGPTSKATPERTSGARAGRYPSSPARCTRLQARRSSTMAGYGCLRNCSSWSTTPGEPRLSALGGQHRQSPSRKTHQLP